MAETTVIRVSAYDREALLADPNFVYVGRRARGGWKDSPWGNPFRASRDSLVYVGSPPRWNAHTQRIAAQQAVAMFRACIETSEMEPWVTMRKRLHELRGKTLGCWCGCWKPGEPELLCHAVVLAKLANAIEGGGQ